VLYFVFLCKLRISAHKLKIEVGHYNKTPRNERFCKKCNTDEIEDEMHFLLLCNPFETDRKNILDLVAVKLKISIHSVVRTIIFFNE
jgi:hypothetical protein